MTNDKLRLKNDISHPKYKENLICFLPEHTAKTGSQLVFDSFNCHSSIMNVQWIAIGLRRPEGHEEVSALSWWPFRKLSVVLQFWFAAIYLAWFVSFAQWKQTFSQNTIKPLCLFCLVQLASPDRLVCTFDLRVWIDWEKALDDLSRLYTGSCRPGAITDSRHRQLKITKTTYFYFFGMTL